MSFLSRLSDSELIDVTCALIADILLLPNVISLDTSTAEAAAAYPITILLLPVVNASPASPPKIVFLRPVETALPAS